MRRIGHRGAKGHAPENTIASFEKAIELGCDEVETDVWLVDDGRLVISHDPPRGGESLTLAEVVAVCRGRVTLNVEIKAARTEALARAAGARVAEHLREARSDAYLSSFWWSALESAREASAAVRRAFIYSAAPARDALIAAARSAGLWALHPNRSYVTPELVRDAHAAGLAVNVWTVNDPQEIAAIAALGVDGICSDYPERVPKS
jgi:glycerophosphoryl diester phosphodiesterase